MHRRHSTIVHTPTPGVLGSAPWPAALLFAAVEVAVLDGLPLQSLDYLSVSNAAGRCLF